MSLGPVAPSTATTVATKRPFSTFDGALQQGQLVGFWDPQTAVLYGHRLDAYNTAQVAIAHVVDTATAARTPVVTRTIGPSLGTLDVPNQDDDMSGPYSQTVPAEPLGFVVVDPLTAILVSGVVQYNTANTYEVRAATTWVYYHVLRRASISAVVFTIGTGNLAGIAVDFPEDTPFTGGDSNANYTVDVLVGWAGLASGGLALTHTQNRPRSTILFDKLGSATVSGSSVTIGGGTSNSPAGTFGRAIGTAHVAPMQIAGAFCLRSGAVNRSLGTPAHSTGIGRPQIVGEWDDAGDGPRGGRLAWAEFTASSVAFHSIACPTSDGDFMDPQYGDLVSLPITGMPIVACDIVGGNTLLGYVPVTMVMSTGLAEVDGSMTGTARVYGAVVDFRAAAELRTNWVLLGTYGYGDFPTTPLVTVSDTTETTITLVWGESTGGEGTLSYFIYASGVLLHTTTDTTWTQTGLAAGQGATYRIIARDVAGNSSAASLSVSAATLPAPAGPWDFDPPAPPTALHYTGGGPSGPSFAWTKSASIDLAHYKIYMHDPAAVGPAGSANLHIRYAAPGASGSTTCGLYINGTRVDTLSFPPTAAATVPADPLTWVDLIAPVTLLAGSNAVALRVDTGDGGFPYIDQMGVNYGSGTRYYNADIASYHAVIRDLVSLDGHHSIWYFGGTGTHAFDGQNDITWDVGSGDAAILGFGSQDLDGTITGVGTIPANWHYIDNQYYSDPLSGLHSYVLRAVDFAGNWSANSNVVSATYIP